MKATDAQWIILFMLRGPMIRILIRPIHDGPDNNNVRVLNGSCDLLKAYSPTPVCHSSFFWPRAAVVFTPFFPTVGIVLKQNMSSNTNMSRQKLAAEFLDLAVIERMSRVDLISLSF